MGENIAEIAGKLEPGDDEREPAATLRRALTRLERAATEVSRLGATTGPQWPKLSNAILRARVALQTTPNREQRLVAGEEGRA